MEGIKDKVIVIAGASSGLGEAAVRSLARDGAKLVLGARRLIGSRRSQESFRSATMLP
jgi:NADP-dependent 3-hydroxy acid dehydrogenase YdfG